MKYSAALFLSLIIGTAQASLDNKTRDKIEESICNLNSAKLIACLGSINVTASEKTRFLNLAEQMQALHLPVKKFYESGPDILRIVAGTTVLKISGLCFLEFLNDRKPGKNNNLVALAACSAFFYYSARHVYRGVNAHSAKANMRKMLSVVDVLKNIQTEA